MKKHIINWSLVILWMGVIFFFSHQPFLKSDLPSAWDFIFRKLAHITEFGVLTFLLFRSFRDSFISGQLPAACAKALIGAGFFALLYACSDEYHQFFILGRQASVFDVSIDSIGILVALLILRKRCF